MALPDLIQSLSIWVPFLSHRILLGGLHGRFQFCCALKAQNRTLLETNFLSYSHTSYFFSHIIHFDPRLNRPSTPRNAVTDTMRMKNFVLKGDGRREM